MRVPESTIDDPAAFGLAAFWLLQSLMAALHEDGRLDATDIDIIFRGALLAVEGDGLPQGQEEAAHLLVTFIEWWRQGNAVFGADARDLE